VRAATWQGRSAFSRTVSAGGRVRSNIGRCRLTGMAGGRLRRWAPHHRTHTTLPVTGLRPVGRHCGRGKEGGERSGPGADCSGDSAGAALHPSTGSNYANSSDLHEVRSVGGFAHHRDDWEIRLGHPHKTRKGLRSTEAAFIGTNTATTLAEGPDWGYDARDRASSAKLGRGLAVPPIPHGVGARTTDLLARIRAASQDGNGTRCSARPAASRTGPPRPPDPAGPIRPPTSHPPYAVVPPWLKCASGHGPEGRKGHRADVGEVLWSYWPEPLSRQNGPFFQPGRDLGPALVGSCGVLPGRGSVEAFREAQS